MEHPRRRAQQATYYYDGPWTVFIDEITFNWNKPCFSHNKNRERYLDRRAAPVMLFVDRVDKQRPAVLHVRDHGHADHAEHELHPRRCEARLSYRAFRFHHLSPWHLLPCIRDAELTSASLPSQIQGGNGIHNM